MPMTDEGLKVYNLELQLIQKYFKGLKPRPVKIVEGNAFDGQADEPFLLINRRLLDNEEKLVYTLIHELLHYDLKDRGEGYYGHGQAFLKRAQELGIFTDYELERCLSIEEYLHTPTRRILVKTPLKEFKEKRIDIEIKKLMDLTLKLPDEYKVNFYPHVQNLAVSLEGLCSAVDRGEAYVIEEILKKKPGPKGKPFEELRKEFKELEIQVEEVRKEVDLHPDDMKLCRKLGRIQDKMINITTKLEKDYGIERPYIP